MNKGLKTLYIDVLKHKCKIHRYSTTLSGDVFVVVTSPKSNHYIYLIYKA